MMINHNDILNVHKLNGFKSQNLCVCPQESKKLMNNIMLFSGITKKRKNNIMLFPKMPTKRSVSSIVEMSLEIGVSPDMVLRWLLETGHTKLEAKAIINAIDPYYLSYFVFEGDPKPCITCRTLTNKCSFFWELPVCSKQCENKEFQGFLKVYNGKTNA